MKSKIYGFAKNIASLLIIISISLVLLELTLHFLFKNYQLSKDIPGLNKYLKIINRANSDIIQFNPECAAYDSQLFYTLKKNSECNFKNREFDTGYKINSNGLRDDEESLKKPQIIVLGDSYAMGWGVNQNETFAQIIEEKTGLKTLNAGVSSYGTAREFLMLQKQDLSNLKYLIIQYCSNDYGENKAFVLEGKLNISSKENYDSLVEDFQNKREKQSKLLRTSFIFIRELIRDIKTKIGVKPSNVEVANYDEKEEFANLEKIITKVRKLVGKDVKIILFEADGIDLINSDLYNYFADRNLKNLAVLDSNTLLLKEDYLILDGHYNSSGHSKIANEITKIISK